MYEVLRREKVPPKEITDLASRFTTHRNHKTRNKKADFKAPKHELLLIKLKASGAQRAEIKRTTDIFRGQIIDVTQSSYTVQLSGTSEKLDAFLRAVPEASVMEVVRSGVSGVSRGDKTLVS